MVYGLMCVAMSAALRTAEAQKELRQQQINLHIPSLQAGMKCIYDKQQSVFMILFGAHSYTSLPGTTEVATNCTSPQA